jgi:hypothetical protein
MRAKVSASFNRGSIFMSKSRWEFRPTTVQRLVKTARAMGLSVCGIEVGRDLIRVLVAEPDAPLLASASAVNAIASSIKPMHARSKRAD